MDSNSPQRKGAAEAIKSETSQYKKTEPQKNEIICETTFTRYFRFLTWGKD